MVQNDIVGHLERKIAMITVEPGWYAAQGCGEFFRLDRVVAMTDEGVPIIARDGRFIPIEKCILTFRATSLSQVLYENPEQFSEFVGKPSEWIALRIDDEPPPVYVEHWAGTL